IICSSRWIRKNPISTNTSALSPASFTDSGITSTNATLSMYPAPSAKKYCKYLRGHSRRTTKYPPSTLPPAATSPRSAAKAVRNAKSWLIRVVRFGVESSKSAGSAAENQRPDCCEESAEFRAPSQLVLQCSSLLETCQLKTNRPIRYGGKE